MIGTNVHNDSCQHILPTLAAANFAVKLFSMSPQASTSYKLIVFNKLQ